MPTTRVPWRELPLVLAVWVATRAALVGAVLWSGAVHGAYQHRVTSTTGDWVIFRLARWDSHLYGAIAQRGYPPAGETCCYQAFFPGYPAVMRGLAPLFGGVDPSGVLWAGEVAVLVAGMVAVAGLYAAARLDLPARQARLAAYLLCLAPLGVFLVVPYTEALWLAAAVWAWWCARTGRWLLAGLLAALACSLRITGLFLVAGLVVLLLVELGGRRARPRAAQLSLLFGPAVVAAWALWLHARTGLWTAWTVAQEQGWGRRATWPWVGASDVLDKLRTAGSWHLRLSRALDVVATLGSFVLSALLLGRRRWAEAVFAGLSAVAMVASSIWESSPRYLLVVFPLYALLARAVGDRPLVRRLLLAGSGALALVLAWCWGAGWWVA